MRNFSIDLGAKLKQDPAKVVEIVSFLASLDAWSARIGEPQCIALKRSTIDQTSFSMPPLQSQALHVDVGKMDYVPTS